MTTSEFETEAVRPIEAFCDSLFVALADGRQVRSPLWWCPYLMKASSEELAEIKLEFAGMWWPELDDGVSAKAMLLGWKAPGAIEPQLAAE